MKEVARVADVSLATVSRVLSGSGEVRPDLVNASTTPSSCSATGAI